MDDHINHRTVPEYNTRAVVNRTGVPADTFRAWERRYGLPNPARTQGNHRLYSERDIAIISWLKQTTEEGVSISRAVENARRRMYRDRTSAIMPGTPPGSSRSRLDDSRHNLLSAITEFDLGRANGLIEDAMALIDIEALCIDILQPVMAEIGSRWERGEATVSTEHFASAFCMRKLSALFTASRPESGDPTVLCSCVEGEHHEVGLMMTAVLLSRAGYRVTYLGANLPARDLASAVRRIRPDAVALSSTTSVTCPALIDAIAAVRGPIPLGAIPIIGFGGAVFAREPARRESIDAEYLGDDARVACRRIDELFASRSRHVITSSR